MQDFIKRNAPVLIIGGITLLVFVGIIVASQSKAAPTPTMKKVEEAVLVADHSFTLGKADAPVTIVEFADFQCPGCAFFFPVLKDYYYQNQDVVRIVYRHLPLSMHPYARKAAEASEVAGKQGLFWEYADILFKNQENLKREDLISYAERLGMNKDDFAKELDSGAYVDVINTDLALAKQLGLNSTPSVFINGEKIVFTKFEDITSQIEEAIAKHKQPDTTDQTSSKTNISPLTAEEVDAKYGTVEITFDGKAFIPNPAPAYKQQQIRWINKSQNDLVLMNTSSKFTEFKEVTLQAGASFGFRPQNDDVLTYEDKTTKTTGSIFVKNTN